MLTIVFRTKANDKVGFGHLKRTLTLAKELRRQGAFVYFIINEDKKALEWLKHYQFEVANVTFQDECHLKETFSYLKQWKADIVIIDSYDVDKWAVSKIEGLKKIIIEDRDDILFPVDMIISGAVNKNHRDPGGSLTRFLIGTDYLLLDDIFFNIPFRMVSPTIQHILITLGGSDPFHLTPTLMEWTREVMQSVFMKVVIGPFFSEEVKEKIKTIAMNDSLIAWDENIPHLYERMTHCDIAITGGGQTTYELAATGTPAIAIQLIDNQACNVEYLSQEGTLALVGKIEDFDLQDKFCKQLMFLSSNQDERIKMSRKGQTLIDAQGVKRVANEIRKLFDDE